MKKIIVIIILLFPVICSAQNVSDYLILKDIGIYKIDVPEKVFAGEPPIGGPREHNSSGIIAGVDHFSLDHQDKTYEVMYLGGDGYPAPTVQVTQHAGADSDKWLLHEIDRDFRNYYGIPGMSYSPRIVDGQIILEDSVGGRNYRWISDNKIIVISYQDSQMTKPEPLDIVKAYLAKHPSTLPGVTLVQLRSDENKTKWIKDEMERRLWLCDKWFEQLQSGNVEQKKALKEVVDHMGIFLSYRDKYFGTDSEADARSIVNYRKQNNEEAIKNKLQEYKCWWKNNKSSGIRL